MSPRAGLPLTRHIASRPVIWLLSLLSGLVVFALASFIQWLIYDDWLHDAGPVQIVGSLLAAALMSAIVFRWQTTTRERRLELLRRFETIRWMNDRIRNSLQAIECVTYARAPEATEQVRAAVDTIESVLDEVLTGATVPAPTPESRPQSAPAR